MIGHQPLYNQYLPYQQNYQQIPQQQMQSSIVSVRSEEEARRYPIAPGNSIMFKIEGQPFVVEKIQGFSQLEGPQIKRYRLTEEEAEPTTAVEYATKGDIERIEGEITLLRDMIPKRPARKEAKDE
jgi:hypothetical protein